MQDILQQYCQPSDTGLLLLSMPTGFGKTYHVLNFIYENYRRFAQEGRKIFFITNLKKNLPDDELKKRFIEKGKESEFDQYVLFINANSETVIKQLPDLDDEIPESFKTDSYHKLKKQIKMLEELKTVFQIPQEVVSEIENKIRKNLEPKFRYSIREQLQEKFKTKKAKLKAIKEHPDYQWIGKLYPAVFTEEKTVLFLSIDKFFLKNDTLIEPSYYFKDKLNKQPLIFIDEFDSTKEAILRQIIDAGLQHKVDLLNLFLNIHNNLVQNQPPEKLLKESEWRRKRREDKAANWLSLDKQIDLFKEKAQQIFNQYHLQYTCKSDENLFEKPRLFLFYDYQVHYVIDRKKGITIIQDPNTNTNWIQSVDFKQETQGNNINKLLADIRGFLTYFKQGVSYLAENYYYFKREEQKTEVEFSFELAVKTVLNHFRLDDNARDFLSSSILEGGLFYNSSTNKKKPKLSGVYNFYEDGFRYYDIVDNDEHDTLSKIYMFEFDRTPESFLSDICSKAMIVGISATAGLHTNIGNYDIKYLDSQLGESFIHLQPQELANLKQRYSEATKGYDKIEINPLFILNDSDSHEEIFKQLVELFEDKEAANDLWSKIKSENSFTKDKDGNYIFGRYVRFLIAWKYFLDNPDCRGFLYFGNKFPKKGDAEFDLDILHEYGELFLQDNPNAISDKISEVMVILDSKNFDQQKEQLREDLQNNKRRFIISTYQTVGVGQNLQFPIPSDVETIQINDFNPNKEMDINGIYLEKPTHLLVHINDEGIKNKTEAFIKHLFQLEFLLENGAISQQTLRSKLDYAFQKYLGEKIVRKNVKNSNLYHTAAYSRFVNKVIIQALGRICRTNQKSSIIHILADASIQKDLNPSYLPPDIISIHEYTALLEAAEQSAKPSQELEECQNRASNVSNRTSAYINKQLYSDWDERNVKLWQELRQQVLRQPTVEKASDCNPQWNNIYLSLPQASNSYYYRQDNDYQDIEVLFAKDHKNKPVMTVNEENSRLPELMSIPLLKELFIQEEWMIDFPTSELMLTPPMFNNIYKGALGEVCGKYILETSLNLKLRELEIEEFELFDFKLAENPNIYIDFKLWNDQVAVKADPPLEKIRDKMEEVSAEQVLTINILASPETPFELLYADEGKIVRIPYLCKNGSIDQKAIAFLKKVLSQE